MRAVLADRLWIGNALDARDLRRLHEFEIKAVVDLAIEEPPAQLTRDIAYLRFPLFDGAGNDPRLLRLAIRTIGALLDAGVPTLVACSGGMSRSPVLVAWALAVASGQQPDACLLELARGEPCDVSPLLWHETQRAMAGK
jgi:protein-tyrosine phosphatase